MGIEEKLPSGFLLTTVEKIANEAHRASLWPATFGLACCAIEMMSSGGPRYDLARFGMEVFRASPRQADLMIVAGRVSQKMAPVLRQIYDQMANPKWVIAMGVCASSGGMFNNYAIVQGVDHVVPVDIYLPGCPPRPEMLIHAIMELHEDIREPQARRQPAGRGRRARAARADRGADVGPARAAAVTTGTPPADDGSHGQVGRPARRRPPRRRGPGAAGCRHARSRTRGREPGARGPGRRHRARATTAARAVPEVVGTRTGMFGIEGTGDTSGLRRAGPQDRDAARVQPAVRRLVRRRRRQPRRRARATAGSPGTTRSRACSSTAARSRSSSDATRCSTCAGVCATRPTCGSSSAPGCPVCTSPTTPAASCTPSTTCCRSPTTGGSGWSRPARTPTRTCPSVVSVYPTNDWHERETFDFFGIIFDGHPALTRIEMPDDWPGHPQRKDYPLGGIPVEFKGATIPPPDQRRAYS